MQLTLVYNRVTLSFPGAGYLFSCDVQPMTALQGIVKITSLVNSSSRTMDFSATPSKHIATSDWPKSSTCKKGRFSVVSFSNDKTVRKVLVFQFPCFSHFSCGVVRLFRKAPFIKLATQHEMQMHGSRSH